MLSWQAKQVLQILQTVVYFLVRIVKDTTDFNFILWLTFGLIRIWIENSRAAVISSHKQIVQIECILIVTSLDTNVRIFGFTVAAIVRLLPILPNELRFEQSCALFVTQKEASWQFDKWIVMACIFCDERPIWVINNCGPLWGERRNFVVTHPFKNKVTWVKQWKWILEGGWKILIFSALFMHQTSIVTGIGLPKIFSWQDWSWNWWLFLTTAFSSNYLMGNPKSTTTVWVFRFRFP